jgi:hypothetical protein
MEWVDVAFIIRESTLKLIPYVFPKLRPLFVSGMELVLHGMVQLSDLGRRRGAWRAFFTFPRMLFWTGPQLEADPAYTPHRADSTHLNYGILEYRLRLFAAGEYIILLEKAQAADDWRRSQLGMATPRTPQPAEARPLASPLARCLQQYQAGSRSRAMAALTSTDSVARATHDTLAELEALFPEAEAMDEELAAQLAAFTPERSVQLTQAALLDALKGMARKSAGGLSGMTTDCMLDPLLDSGPLRDALLPVLQQVVDADVPPEVVPLLRDCRIIGLLKPNGGIRPIAMGEWLRRLSSRLLLRGHISVLREVLEPVQLGVGTPSGVDTAARSVQAYIQSPLGEGMVLVRHAFGSIVGEDDRRPLRAKP